MSVGIKSLQMGVFGGVLVGSVLPRCTTVLSNRAASNVLIFRWHSVCTYRYRIDLCGCGHPDVLYLANDTGRIMHLGALVNRAGYAGTFIYGFIERALIPFGLHHVFYMPFWQTGLEPKSSTVSRSLVHKISSLPNWLARTPKSSR